MIKGARTPAAIIGHRPMDPVTPSLPPRRSDVLLVVDVQRDFCPGGPLAVPDGDEVIAPINRLLRYFPHAIATQDWHPPGHQSFASMHPGAKPFDVVEMAYGRQTLWPDHCVQGTVGAELHPDLIQTGFELVLRKGFRAELDSYSAFIENDQATPTGLAGYLRERGFGRIFIAGLALDFCVRYSTEHARRLGFSVTVILDACRGLDQQGSLGAALSAIRASGAHLAAVAEIVGAPAA